MLRVLTGISSSVTDTVYKIRMAGVKKCIQVLTKHMSDMELEKGKHDTYTVDVLRQNYNAYKDYYLHRMRLNQTVKGKPVRYPIMPEDISENIVKFIIHNHLGDTTCTWNCKKGDLYSEREKQQECKTFMSDGPSSFGPQEDWDVIYFLDARKWLDNTYILYRVNLSNRDDAWKNIRMNKTQTFEDQCKQGRRPRIAWNTLYPQVKDHCELIYEGTFENIFQKNTIPSIPSFLQTLPISIPTIPFPSHTVKSGSPSPRAVGYRVLSPESFSGSLSSSPMSQSSISEPFGVSPNV